MRHIDIVLTDAFPILSLTLVTEPLRLVNRESREMAYSWRVLSDQGGRLLSSSGFPIETERLDEARADAVLLMASYRPEAAMTPTLMSWLKRHGREGTLMGCVDTGALLFAAAGLLSHRPAAVHFEAMVSYAETYGEGLFVDRLYDFSPPRCSAAGGVSTMDMTLALIEHFSGTAMARRVASILTHLPSGHLGAQERLIGAHEIAQTDPRLAAALDLMFSTLSMPLSIAEIGKRLDLEPRILNSIFRRHIGQTPAAYYRSLRLERALNLLRNSHHPVGTVAILCGFENHETFTRAYRRQYGIAPSAERDA